FQLIDTISQQIRCLMRQFPSGETKTLPQCEQQAQTPVFALDSFEIVRRSDATYAVEILAHVLVSLFCCRELLVCWCLNNRSFECVAIAPYNQRAKVKHPRSV